MPALTVALVKLLGTAEIRARHTIIIFHLAGSDFTQKPFRQTARVSPAPSADSAMSVGSKLPLAGAGESWCHFSTVQTYAIVWAA
jgi:hypothetical protein